LCSVAEPELVALEAKRVLKPDGQLLFLEHGLSDQPAWARWQRQLNPVQKVIGCGCNLIRDPVQILTSAGLRVRTLFRGTVPGFPGPAPLFPLVQGIAHL
jgi:ubiquinone/menaquinone biosynthesis C-methylase UbiE